jgi:hypothetical protein
VTDGVLIRELPDGDRELVFEDPVLAALVVSDGVTLRFGRTDLTVTGPFVLEVDGAVHGLDPSAPESLAPLLACVPGAARWVWASPDGRLTVTLMQGQRLVVPGGPDPGRWRVDRAPGPPPPPPVPTPPR